MKELSGCEAKLVRGMEERRELREELEEVRRAAASLGASLDAEVRRGGGGTARRDLGGKLSDLTRELDEAKREVMRLTGVLARERDQVASLSKEGADGRWTREAGACEMAAWRGIRLSSISAITLLSPIALAKSPRCVSMGGDADEGGLDLRRVVAALFASRVRQRACLIVVRWRFLAQRGAVGRRGYARLVWRRARLQALAALWGWYEVGGQARAERRERARGTVSPAAKSVASSVAAVSWSPL